MGAMLMIDLQRLRRDAAAIGVEVGSDDPFWEGTEIDLAVPMQVRVRAELTASHNVWVRGSFATRIRSGCRRCLEPMEIDVAESFEMLFDSEIGPADEDFNLYILDAQADELDLKPPIRERVLLKVPSYPLCREDCHGLCVHCGANLNEGDCGCRVVERDPRWGPLLEAKGGS